MTNDSPFPMHSLIVEIEDASGSDYQGSSDGYEDSTNDAPLHEDAPAEPWGNYMQPEYDN
jgi:hypothetical protein